MLKSLFSLLLIVPSLFLQGQELNPVYYKYGATPSALPEFLLNETRGQHFFLGISNPDIDSVDAIDQAIQRARGLFYLAQAAKVKTVSDFFKGEKFSGNGGIFQSLVEISNYDSAYPGYTVIDTFFTRFNEAIVRIKPKKEFKNNYRKDFFYDVHLEKYGMEYQWGGALEFGDQTQLCFKFSDTISTIIDSLTYFSSTRFYTVETIYNGVRRDLPILRYNYADTQNKEQQFFKAGLWVHIMDEIIHRIADKSRTMCEDVKKTQENYQSNTQLGQGIAANMLSFTIEDITLHESEVDVTIHFNVAD